MHCKLSSTKESFKKLTQHFFRSSPAASHPRKEDVYPQCCSSIESFRPRACQGRGYPFCPQHTQICCHKDMALRVGPTISGPPRQNTPLAYQNVWWVLQHVRWSICPARVAIPSCRFGVAKHLRSVLWISRNELSMSALQAGGRGSNPAGTGGAIVSTVGILEKCKNAHTLRVT